MRHDSILRKASSRRKGWFGKFSTAKLRQSVHHRHLACEVLEDRRLLSLAPVATISDAWIKAGTWVDNDKDGFASALTLEFDAKVNEGTMLVYANVHADDWLQPERDLGNTGNYTLTTNDTRQTFIIPVESADLSHTTWDFQIDIYSAGTAERVARLGMGADPQLNDVKIERADDDLSSYMLYDHFGGTWHDANKSAFDFDDDNLCWAAAASNVLAWTGWGAVEQMTSSQQIFTYFQDHWTDEGGQPKYGWEWWFNGTNPAEGEPNWSQANVSGGSFWPQVEFDHYASYKSVTSDAMEVVSTGLRGGKGVTLGISADGWLGGDHAITAWGYSYGSSPTDYRGLWITDSDDFGSLKYYDVALNNSQWSLQDYTLWNLATWYIDGVSTLSSKPEPTEQMIDSGLEWLGGKQQTNGSWSNDAAITSMAVLTMLNAGYTETDTGVSNGIDFILSQVHADGSVGHEPSRYTYRTALAILPLVATRNSAYQPTIEKMRTWLINSQWDEDSAFGSKQPSDWYYGGFGYGGSERPDLSNTQFALMGLSAADQYLGLNASEVYRKAREYFLPRCQGADGGGSYVPRMAPDAIDYRTSIHTMTSALVWSYRLAGLDAGDVKVKAGIDWLANHYSITNNDGWYNWSEYYYKMTFAKALVMSHKDTLGSHKWFDDLSAALLSEQQPSGNWPDTGMPSAGQPSQEMNTAWAIWALQTRTLPVGADLSMTFILESHADLHVYDPAGNHLGVNYVTASLDQQIPGATLKYYLDGNHDGIYDPSEEQQPTNYLDIPVEWVQISTLPQLTAGSYRTELVGTSNGPFELTVQGSQNGASIPGGEFSGTITPGEKLATTTTVTAMEGALTLLSEPLAEMPTMAVIPASAHIYVAPGATAQKTFEVMETGGNMTLHSVSIYANDFTGPWGTIPGSSITFDTNHFDVPAETTQVVTVSYPIPADFVGAVSGTIVIQSDDGGSKSMAVTLESNPLFISAFSPTASGVHVGFNRPVDQAELNVYGTQAAPGPIDVVLVGPRGAVAGSLLVEGTNLTFIKTGGLLEPGDYTITLRSAVDGFKDSETGQLLDGEYSGTFPTGDGTPGGDFVCQFTVSAPASIVVGLPDFAQGPGQSAGSAGLPIHLSNAAGVESVDFTLSYDPDVLNITAVSLGPDVVEGSMVHGDFSVPGRVKVSFFALNPMPAGAADIISLSAVVPSGATYGAAEVLHVSDLRINEGVLPATADDAVHVVAYLGDATGNGGDLWKNDPSHLEDTYSGLDAQKVSRVAAKLDSGFAAYPLIDPLIIGDVTGNGSFSGLDASYLLEEATGDCPDIPPLPSPPANAQPIATAQAVTTAEEVPLAITLAGDDGDPEVVQTLTYAIATQPSHGTLSGDASTGTVNYTPNPDFNGTDSFTFTVADDDKAGPAANLTSAAATVTIVVTPVNKRPVANAQTITMPENATKAIALTGDDSDPLPGEVQTLTFAITAQPLHGTLSGFNIATGAVTYTPDHGYFGSDSFKFCVIDDNTAGRPYGLMSDEATVSITVTDVNDPPSFTKGSNQTINEDAGVQTVAGWATNISPGAPNESGQVLAFIVSADTPALFQVQPAIDATSGTLTYTPAANANGSTVVTVRLHDNGGTADGGQDTSAPQTFTITVNPVNDAPSFTKGADQTVNEDAGAQTVPGWATAISAGPADEAGQVLAFEVTNDNNGLFSAQPIIAANGTLTYTPANNANGFATVTVVLKDNGGTANGGADTSATQTFTIIVNAINDPPVVGVAPNPASTPEDTPLTFLMTMEDGDPEVAQNLTWDILVPPAHGTLELVPIPIPEGIPFLYTPDPNYSGPDGFTFAVTDDAQAGLPGPLTTSVSVPIQVTPVNDPPVNHVPAPQAIAEDQWLTFSSATGNAVSVSDDDAGTDPIQVTLACNLGRLAILPDGQEGSSIILVDTIASVNAMLQHLGYLPPQNYNGPASIQVVTNDQGHNGSGGPLSDTDTIGVTVSPVNDPPVVSLPPMPVVTLEDTPKGITITVGDGDPEVAQNLTITLLSGPSHGTLSVPPVGIMIVDPGSTTVTYTPDPNYNGPDGFTFRVTDDAQAGPPANLWTDATVTISVSPVNDRPVAFSQDLTTPLNTPLPVTLNGDDSDPEVVQTLAYAIVNEPQHGTLSDLTAGHQVTYTPNPGYSGPDQFTFIVIDDDKAGPVAYLASQPPAPVNITVGSSLLAAGAPAAGMEVAPLAQTDLQPIVNEAIARWAVAGLSTQAINALAGAQFVITDLPGTELGFAAGKTIYLDRDAAGYGWFVDLTPAKDEEFAGQGSAGQLQAIDPWAVDRMDLLSVVEHELGHLAGLEDLDWLDWPDSSLMSGSLAKGIRRSPTAKEVEAVFAADDLLT